MSTSQVMIPDAGAVPAHLQASGPVDSGLVTGSESLPRISLKGKQFRFIIDGEEKMTLPLGTPLDVIILAASPKSGCSKVYYRGSYSSGDNEAPDCSSADGLYPDKGIAYPQSELCQTCKQNAWGSGIRADGTPSDGKACRDTKTLFVVGPKKINGTMLQLRVPVMSLKSLNSLGHSLENRRMHSYAIMTRMEFVDSEFPQVEFSFGAFLDKASYAAAAERANSTEVQKLVESAVTTPGTPPAEKIPEDAPGHVTQDAAEPDTGTTAAAEETQPVDLDNLWGDDAQAGEGIHDASEPKGPVQGATAQETADSQEPFKGPGQNPADGLWYDKSGTVWNQELHGTATGGGPAFKKDGTFKTKRGLNKDQPEQQPSSGHVSGAQRLGPDTGTDSTVTEEDLLDGWA